MIVIKKCCYGWHSERTGRREAAISHARGFRLIEVLSGRRETHPRYLWNIECECRAGSKCAVVSAAPGGGLATLHLRHLSAVPGRSYGEWILHSKLNLPALLAIHSAALAPKGYFPQSSSASRFTAGAFGFLILSQSGERPERYVEPSRFDTIPSQPSLQACSKTISPSPS